MISILPMLAFAAPSLELSSHSTSINPSDSFLVFGKVMGVTSYSTVNLSLVAPDDELIYSFNVDFDKEGNFKRLIHPPISSFKSGEYTIIATHAQVSQPAKLTFTVIGKDIPSGIIKEITPTPQDKTKSDMYIVANAVEGDTEISIVGKTFWSDRDITLKVSSPNGNLITVAQVTPMSNGDFSATIKIGGPMWKEDGLYTVTAYQGDNSELKDSVQVDIANGVVVPEFGSIAAMILAVSIISLIAFSAKSRLSLVPRL
ncbi:MAG: PEFG-CTERM domain-containing protein [Nitrosopumilales archaeon CG15_BIG_FIL_POST_REV_8_21_14_020_37_12]|nr:MAG: PEFG-CTERM domain-containing protein [Nitrosopumilales archaeon CG15_BIG_FIL_POST_REV_8_21_14_020_37_12]